MYTNIMLFGCSDNQIFYLPLWLVIYLCLTHDTRSIELPIIVSLFLYFESIIILHTFYVPI